MVPSGLWGKTPLERKPVVVVGYGHIPEVYGWHRLLQLLHLRGENLGWGWSDDVIIFPCHMWGWKDAASGFSF